MKQAPQLGKRIEDGDRRRDAVHIAIAAVTAETRLSPGQHIGLIRGDSMDLVGPSERNLGIVDPFLTGDVEPGQRFWRRFPSNKCSHLAKARPLTQR